jgi:hypothetical protein
MIAPFLAEGDLTTKSILFLSLIIVTSLGDGRKDISLMAQK